MFVCVVSLSQPSSGDLGYPLCKKNRFRDEEKKLGTEGNKKGVLLNENLKNTINFELFEMLVSNTAQKMYGRVRRRFCNVYSLRFFVHNN